MAMLKAISKALLKNGLVLAALYACFDYLGDFSQRESGVLTVVAWIGYALYEDLSASRAASNVFSPFCFSVYPKWYELLFDLKLIDTQEEWDKVCQAVHQTPERGDTVFPRGFFFTVIKPPAHDALPPGLIFWNDRKVFLAEADLSEPLIDIEDGFRPSHSGEEHPFFHHPRWSSLPRLCFKCGNGGYEIGLEVEHDWWENLRSTGRIGDLANTIKSHRDYPGGTTRLVIAKLPYSEFCLFYENIGYGDLEKVQKVMNKRLETNGWKRKDEGNSEFPDPWSRVEHKYFSVSHRSI